MYSVTSVYTDKIVDDFYRFLRESVPLEVSKEKIKLDVFRSDRYISPDAWADTMPSERVIRRLPEELSDYSLPIEKHEVLHNAFPDATESFIRSAAYNPSFDTVVKRFELVYH
jgi:hypothetical protein